MNKYKQIQQIFPVLLLVGILLFPASIQLAHAMGDHEHKACEEITTHIHENNLDCSLFDFNFSSYHYEFSNPLDPTSVEISIALQSAYFSSVKNIINPYFYLRGPPSTT